MRSYLRSLSMTRFYMSLRPIEYGALPDATLGQRTGYVAMGTYNPTPCPEYSTHREER